MMWNLFLLDSSKSSLFRWVGRVLDSVPARRLSVPIHIRIEVVWRIDFTTARSLAHTPLPYGKKILKMSKPQNLKMSTFEDSSKNQHTDNSIPMSTVSATTHYHIWIWISCTTFQMKNESEDEMETATKRRKLIATVAAVTVGVCMAFSNIPLEF